jgi:NAD(P)-dependent dehydrogenase (short-subunit alcohol dehydrogenase family)
MYLWRRLSKAFPESSFKPIVFDVCDQPAVLRAVAVVRSKLQNQHLFGIVNNAGIGLCGPSALVPIEDVRQMLETNLVGPLIVSQAFIPLLGGEKSLQGMRELQFDIVVICALYLF